VEIGGEAKAFVEEIAVRDEDSTEI
jgi:hypothetical protein